MRCRSLASLLGLVAALLASQAAAQTATRPIVEGPPSVEVSAAPDPGHPLTILWDPNTDAVDGYRLHYSNGTPGVYTTHVDVGKPAPALDPGTGKPAVSWQTPALSAGTYFFAVTAYRFLDDASCVPPFGANAVSIFITKVGATTGRPGSNTTIYFQLGSPNSPVTDVHANLNGAPVGTPVSGTAAGGLWFPLPLQLGTFTLSVTATNAAGCSTTVTKDAIGRALTVTVK